MKFLVFVLCLTIQVSFANKQDIVIIKVKDVYTSYCKSGLSELESEKCFEHHNYIGHLDRYYVTHKSTSMQDFIDHYNLKNHYTAIIFVSDSGVGLCSGMNVTDYRCDIEFDLSFEEVKTIKFRTYDTGE